LEQAHHLSLDVGSYLRGLFQTSAVVLQSHSQAPLVIARVHSQSLEKAMSNEVDSRYPIGKFRPLTSISSADRKAAVKVIAELPVHLREAVKGLDASQMDTPYRDGGWNVRQVVHHLADSHMTAFHRVRRALTEEMPVVPGYSEKAFAKLADSTSPAEWSLEILDGVHARWTMLLESLNEDQWKRSFQHMERGPSTIEAATILYAWHCKHHVAHITELRKKMGW
jgi:hypothetical protein